MSIIYLLKNNRLRCQKNHKSKTLFRSTWIFFNLKALQMFLILLFLYLFLYCSYRCILHGKLMYVYVFYLWEIQLFPKLILWKNRKRTLIPWHLLVIKSSFRFNETYSIKINKKLFNVFIYFSCQILDCFRN